MRKSPAGGLPDGLSGPGGIGLGRRRLNRCPEQSRLPVSWWVWRLVAAIGLTLLVVTTTARLTLLDAGFDAKSVGDADGYDRAYAQVLPSPAVQLAIRRALAGLPVDPGYLTTNLRVLIPPAVLEEVVRNAISDYVDVVLGRAPRLDLERALQPIVDNLVRLVQELAPNAIVTAPKLHVGSLAMFDAQVTTLFRQLSAGQVDLHLPVIRLRGRDVERVANILTTGLPALTAARLRPQITPLLASGDLGGAFALVVPAYLNAKAVHTIGVNASASAGKALRSLPTVAHDAAPHKVLPLGLGWLTCLGIVFSMALLEPFLGSSRRRTGDIAATMGIATVMALLTGLVLRAVVADPLRKVADDPALDPAIRHLAADIDDQLRIGVARMFMILTAVLALGAIVVWFVPRVRFGLVRGHRRVTSIAVLTVIAGAVTAFANLSTQSPAVCNGSPRLCGHAYDEVSYLTSHNAMASSDRGFLAANQDPDITSQLDNGVRALMLDLHYWTTPSQAAPYLASLDPRTAQALSPLVRSFEPHPGVWLCHELCQLGADSATSQLHALGDWMTGHPGEVVTLILEDDISAADVRTVVSAAGLDPLLATPPAPGEPWPTLGQMVREHHTLMVFTQRARFTSGQIRNFYQYAAETPYDTPTSADLSCAPGRGAASAPLFLLNNWIGQGLATRANALEVNHKSFLLDRARRCEEVRRLHATFIAVDFAQVGAPLEVVDTLNARLD